MIGDPARLVIKRPGAHLAGNEAGVDTLHQKIPLKVKNLPKHVTKVIFDALIAEANWHRRFHDGVVTEQIDAFHAELGIPGDPSN